jgi:galactokinase
MSLTPQLELLAKAAADEFARRLRRPPRWLVAAPGRVNLIGEHTDYNDGFVLPMAIDRHVVIAADRVPAQAPARLFSTAFDQWATVTVRGSITPGPGGWASYVQGVIAGCLAVGLDAGPFEAVIHTDLPLGGGLSSSAALEVATATLLEAMTGRRLDPLQKVLLCQKAEHDFAGVPCGVMDQFSSVLGRADTLLLLDCRALTVERTPLSDPEVLVLIVNSNVKHALTDGGYAARRQQCEAAARILGVPALRDATHEQLDERRDALGDVPYRRARHVVSEIARTVAAAAALRRGDWAEVGRLMYASHASLRDDFAVSCAELDLLVDLAAALGPAGGVIGSRMTGGGFGGCTVSLVRRESVDPIARHIREGYLQRTGRPATVFVTRPADGARILTGTTPDVGS